MNGLSKVSVADTNATFDLGDLRGSKSYYFILSNIGSTSINNITLTTSDSSVVVTPSTIGVLYPNDSSSIMQTVKVTILHGTILENGVGSKPLQPMGALEKYIHIQGTSAGLTSINVTLDMYSYVMDASISND